VVVTRQVRHFEPSMRRVLGTNENPKAESADRESPSRGVVAERQWQMSQAKTRATNQMPPIHKRLCHIVVFTILRGAQVGLSTNLGSQKK
jgi:hypothetical protein